MILPYIVRDDWTKLGDGCLCTTVRESEYDNNRARLFWVRTKYTKSEYASLAYRIQNNKPTLKRAVKEFENELTLSPFNVYKVLVGDFLYDLNDGSWYEAISFVLGGLTYMERLHSEYDKVKINKLNEWKKVIDNDTKVFLEGGYMQCLAI